MTIYAVIITWLFGVLCGSFGIIALCDWLDRRAIAKLTKAHEEAVNLVGEELGGTILSYEKKA